MYAAARASCLDLSSEIGEFDSVSQISCMDSHDRWHFVRRNGSMSVSSDVLSGDDFEDKELELTEADFGTSTHITHRWS